MTEWKNVIKQRPEPGEPVLVTNGKEVRIGYIGCGGCSGPYDPRINWMTLIPFDLDGAFCPTHWMPLPNVPSAGEVQLVNDVSDRMVKKAISEIMR